MTTMQAISNAKITASTKNDAGRGQVGGGKAFLKTFPKTFFDNFPCGWEPHANQVTARWGEGWRELS